MIPDRVVKRNLNSQHHHLHMKISSILILFVGTLLNPPKTVAVITIIVKMLNLQIPRVATLKDNSKLCARVTSN